MDFDEDPNYLELDDILAHTQTVNCELLLNIPGLEFLSPGNSAEMIQGAQFSLPYWMAKNLYTYSMIDIDVPKQYQVNFRDIIEADADIIDLHRAGPYYYHLGKLLVGLRREKGNNLARFTAEGQRNKYRREEGETLVDRRTVAASLMETFHNRQHNILEYSTNKSLDQHDRARHFERRLDNMEKRLYQLGRQHVEDLKEWDSRRIETIKNNLIAARLAKRRKLEASSESVR